MQIGKLRHRVELQGVKRVKNGYMADTDNWTTFATQWASIEPLQGTQALIAQQIEAEMTHRVVIRYNANMTADCRVKQNSRIFTIISVRDIDERRRHQELMCKEAV